MNRLVVTGHKIVGTLAKMGTSAAISLGMAEVLPEERERRLAICETCDLLKLPERRCNSKLGGCKCFVDQKTRLLTQKCPLNKW